MGHPVYRVAQKNWYTFIRVQTEIIMVRPGVINIKLEHSVATTIEM